MLCGERQKTGLAGPRGVSAGLAWQGHDSDAVEGNQSFSSEELGSGSERRQLLVAVNSELRGGLEKGKGGGESDSGRPCIKTVVQPSHAMAVRER